jgi:hypothetical protein
LEKSLVLFALGALLVGFIGVSCQNEEAVCNNVQVPLLQCKIIYDSKNAPDSFIFYLPELNDTLYNKKSIPEYLNVPLNSDADSTWLIMTIRRTTDATRQLISNIILIEYKPEMELVNLECGYNYVFKKLKMAYDTLNKHEIDSIIQFSTEINQKKTTHAKIYIN